MNQVSCDKKKSILTIVICCYFKPYYAGGYLKSFTDTMLSSLPIDVDIIRPRADSLKWLKPVLRHKFQTF